MFLNSSFEIIRKAGVFANLDANLWTKFKCVELVTVFSLTLTIVVCRNSSLSNDDKCMTGLLLHMLACTFSEPLNHNKECPLCQTILGSGIKMQLYSHLMYLAARDRVSINLSWECRRHVGPTW